MNAPPAFKGAGYLISTVSVVLLGVTSWKSASESPWLMAFLLLGMLFSVLGMGCRWISFRLERKEEGKDSQRR